jgi:hypothetical protein
MAFHTKIKVPGVISGDEHGRIRGMGIMTAYTGKLMPLVRRVGDPMGWMLAMPGPPKIRGNHMSAVTMIGMTAYTQKPDGFVKPAGVF